MAQSLILRARYLWPGAGEIIENGALLVSGSRIAALGRWGRIRRSASGKILDLGEAVLLPGFINCHTHLELTDLEGKIPPQRSFDRWLNQLVAKTLPWSKSKFTRSAARGLKLNLISGTTLLGDISYVGYDYDVLKKSPLRKILFLEAIDFNPATAASTAAKLEKKLLEIKTDEFMILGIAPHSPYTASGALYQECLRMAKRLDLPISTHLAETEEEREFLMKGTGDFTRRLRRWRLFSRWQPPGSSPLKYMYSLGLLNLPLVIAHGNFLDEKDIGLLERSAASVIYCPSSHKYFGHPPHPFQRLLARGVNVALGTDSLASGRSLSMLDEMKIVARDYKDVSPESLLKMATIHGARALGLEDKVGSLEVGKEADLIALAADATSRPLEALFCKDRATVFTMVAGKVLYKANENLKREAC